MNVALRFACILFGYPSHQYFLLFVFLYVLIFATSIPDAVVIALAHFVPTGGGTYAHSRSLHSPEQIYSFTSETARTTDVIVKINSHESCSLEAK